MHNIFFDYHTEAEVSFILLFHVHIELIISCSFLFSFCYCFLFVCFLLSFVFSFRFSVLHYLGALVIIGGIFFVVWPKLTNKEDEKNNEWWAAVSLH